MTSLPKYAGFEQERTIGEYKIILPDPPNLKDIGNNKLAKEKQKFYAPQLPPGIKQWPKEDQMKFISEEWEKRNNGYWYFNNGNLEYITGTHYLYVAWWKIDIGLPSFIDSDRDWFYMWRHAELDPKSCGMINLENRRGGKTFRSTCVLYDGVSKTQEVQGGIQSKTDIDASKVFRKLISSWQKLPYFFKPVDVGETRPAKALEFFESRKRDTKNINKEYAQVLNSLIDFESSKEEGYDGTKQFRNFQDEIGKSQGVNVDERIKIVKECVMDGTTVVGKILATSTVEEMEKKGGKYCKMVWDKSDPTKRDENGFTKSGLMRYFKPSDYGLRGLDTDGSPFIDEYGYSDRAKALAYLERKRKNLTSEDLASERRKYPLVIRDCFVTDTKKAVYDLQKIDTQLAHNETISPAILQRGNFIWKGGIRDTEVVWVNDPNGKWLVTWLQKQDLRNNFRMTYGQRCPGNTDSGCFGLDPYDNKLVAGNKKSNAASYGFRMFHPLFPHETGIFVTEYVNRPPTPEIMWEDMILQAVFYGWEILVESNKIGTINHFRQRGYYNYLMERPEETQTEYSAKTQKEKGIPLTSEDARLALIRVTQSHIYNHVGLIEEPDTEPYYGKCYFDRLLDDWKEFDFETKWTEFDCMVGAGLALLGSRKQLPKPIEQISFNFAPKYKIVGNSSHRM